MNNRTRQLVFLAFLSAVSCILYFFEIPIPGNPFKFDLSDLPVLIAGLWFGFSAGISVAVVKNIIHALFLSKDPNIIGEISNLVYIVGLLAVFLYMTHKYPKHWILGGIAAILVSTVVMHVFNYYISFPIYGITSGKEEMLITMFLPLNLLKGSVLMLGIHYLSPQLEGIKSSIKV